MERTIRVTGTGKISAPPDQIEITIHVEGTHEQYEIAVEKASEDTGIVREAIRMSGADPRDLKTSSFSVEADYQDLQDGSNNWVKKFLGYKYRESFRLKIPNDNKLLGKILYRLAECKVKGEFSFSYTVKDPDALKNKLLENAVKDSREKAFILTGAAGVSLGTLTHIDYSWNDAGLYSQPMMLMKTASPMGRSSEGFDLDISASDITLEETVTLEWEII